MLKISTTSSKKTKEAARSLVEKVLKKSAGNSALIIALTGDLGAGKTTFVQGFCKGAGVKKRITSPTFVLVKSYKLKTKSYDKIYHIDCYRLTPEELAALNFQEIINNPQNIILIEWAEKIKKILPKKNAIWLKFDYGEKENERNITLR